MLNKMIFYERAHGLTGQEAFDYFTKPDLLRSFFGQDHQIDLRPFGAYEIYFSLEAPKGLRGSEGCKVLSYLPGRMLSFTWNAPPAFPKVRDSSYHTWVVIEFEDSKIRLYHLGWPQGQEWEDVFHYFEEAWAFVLDEFVKSTS